jgi:hypothetical protein
MTRAPHVGVEVWAVLGLMRGGISRPILEGGKLVGIVSIEHLGDIY